MSFHVPRMNYEENESKNALPLIYVYVYVKKAGNYIAMKLWYMCLGTSGEDTLAGLTWR